jgi:hypothetical protein
LKQLRDTIADIYQCKVKFDKKCEENRQPKETMEQFMYTYLNQKYGLKALVVEWASAILNGVKQHTGEDHEVTLFDKVIKNECDEEFRFIEAHFKETMYQSLKTILKEKYFFKIESEIAKLADSIVIGASALEDWMWRKLIERLCDTTDSEAVSAKLALVIADKRRLALKRHEASIMLTCNRKLSRDELKHAMLLSHRVQEKLLYSDFVSAVLDYQLHEHLKFLFRFTVLFKLVDHEGRGTLSEEQFR